MLNPQKNHYVVSLSNPSLVSYDIDVDSVVQHIWAPDKQTAISEYLNGLRDLFGIEVDDFEGVEVGIVLNSAIHFYTIETAVRWNITAKS